MSPLRKTFSVLAAAATLAVAGCHNGPPPTPAPSGGGGSVGTAAKSGLGSPVAKVNETDTLKFDPSTNSVNVGDVIQWTNAGSAPHNVTFDAPADTLTSATMGGGDIWQVKFSQPGTYKYQCTFHAANGMTGTITVGGTAAAGTAAPATSGAGSPTAAPSLTITTPTPAPTAANSGTPGPSHGTAAKSGLGTPATSVSETDAPSFSPTSSTLKVGEVIQWTNTGTVQPHNVTFDSDFDLTSGLMAAGDTWQVKFSAAGSYPYHCTVHPGMNGTVTVTS